MLTIYLNSVFFKNPGEDVYQAGIFKGLLYRIFYDISIKSTMKKGGLDLEEEEKLLLMSFRIP